MMLYPAIVSDDNLSTRGLIADTIMAHGHAESAKMWRKKLCFSLYYFHAFGKMPQH